MTTYRIALVFDKNHPRMSGRGAWGTQRIKRGVWRVADCWPTESDRGISVNQLMPELAKKVLVMNSADCLKTGTLCNPRRILAGYMAQRDLCRAVDSLARKPVVTGYGVTV
jgi:hypothetical protein